MAKELNEMELNNASSGAQATNIITDPQIIKLLGLKRHNENESAENCPSYQLSPLSEPDEVGGNKKCANCAHSAQYTFERELSNDPEAVYCMLGL